jgi:hypothetical protein
VPEEPRRQHSQWKQAILRKGFAKTWECAETKWLDAQDVQTLVFEIHARKLFSHTERMREAGSEHWL